MQFNDYLALPHPSALRAQIKEYKKEITTLQEKVYDLEEMACSEEDADIHAQIVTKIQVLESEIGWRETAIDEAKENVENVQHLHLCFRDLQKGWSHVFSTQEIRVMAVAAVADYHQGLSFEEFGLSEWIPTLKAKGALIEDVKYPLIQVDGKWVLGNSTPAHFVSDALWD